MSSIAFISDLHASLTALEAVLSDIESVGVDRTVCLGDIVDLGPSPSAIIDRLRALGIPSVRGNHDTLDEEPELPKLAAIETWTREQLDAERLAWLRALPPSIEVDLAGLRLLCVHGSPLSDVQSIVASTPDAQLREWSEGLEFDVLLCGHTHVQLSRRLGEQIFVNVGSVGMPFERPFDGPPPRCLPWSEYAVLHHEEGRLSIDLRRVPLDLEAFRAEMHASSIPDVDGWLDQWDPPEG